MKSCGHYIGEDVKLVLLEFKTTTTEVKLFTEFEQFIQAFWLSAFDIELHLDGCTQNSEEAWEVIQKVMYLIGDWSDPIQIATAINYIISHYSAFTHAFDQCSDSIKEIAEGVIQISWFEDTEGAIYYF